MKLLPVKDVSDSINQLPAISLITLILTFISLLKTLSPEQISVVDAPSCLYNLILSFVPDSPMEMKYPFKAFDKVSLLETK